MTDVELWFTCNNCGDEQIIHEGEEFNDLTGQSCTFCINGNYGHCKVFQNGKEIGSYQATEG